MMMQMVRLGDVCRAAKEGQQDLTVAERSARKGPYAYFADNCQSFGVDDWLVDAGGAIIVPAYGQIVTNTGYVMARKEQGRFSFGKQVYALVPHDRTDTDYLYNVITHSPQVAHQVTGTPQLRQISLTALLASRIPWPCRAVRDTFVEMIEADEAEFKRLRALPAQLMAEGDEAFASIVGADGSEALAMADAVAWRTGTSVAAELRGPDKVVRVEGSRGTLGRCDEVLAEGPCVVAAPQGRAMVARYVPEACHPLQDVLYACAADSKIDLGVLLFVLRAARVREGLPRQDWVSEQDFGALCLRVGTPEQQERFASVASDIFDRLAKAEADLVQLERDHAARLAEFFTHGCVGVDGSSTADDEPLGEIPVAPEAVAACGKDAGKGQEDAADAGSTLADLHARVAQVGVLAPLAAQGLGILSDPADVAWELAPLAVVRACASSSQWAFVAAAAGPYAAPAYANLVRALDTVMTELSESNDLLSFLPNLSYGSSLLTLEQLAGWVGMLDAIEPGTITGAAVRAVLRLDSSFAVLPDSVNGLLEGAVRSCARGLGREPQSAYVPCSSGEGLIDLFAHDFPEVTLRSQTQEFSHILADMLVRAAELEGMGEQRGGLGAAVGSALAHDEFSDWQADLVCAVLPCEEGAWHEGAVSPDDPRWAALGVPPRNKATFAWIQQAMFHQVAGGAVVLLAPNCALHSCVGSETELRRKLATSGRVRAVVSLPSRIFADGRLASSLIVLGDPRDAACAQMLMVDMLGCGVPADGAGAAATRELPAEVAAHAAQVLAAWVERGEASCEQGFCRVVGAEEIAANVDVLTPWTYVG